MVLTKDDDQSSYVGSYMLTAAFGISKMGSEGAEDLRLLKKLLTLTQIPADLISIGVPGLRGSFTKKFRRSADAMEFLNGSIPKTTWIGATQRNSMRSEEDIASAEVNVKHRRIIACYIRESADLATQGEELVNLLADVGACYGYVTSVESHTFGLCVGHGTSLAEEMTPELQSNVKSLGRYLRAGGDFSDLLLDIFPSNIISYRHLEVIAAQKTLEAFIVTENLGVLKEIGNRRFWWQLELEELRKAREVLRPLRFTLFS